MVRSAKRERDRWISFVWDLTQAEKKLRNGKIYAQISKEEKIGIDINAYPFHLALAYT